MSDDGTEEPRVTSTEARASIICRVGGVQHVHESVAAVRGCAGVAAGGDSVTVTRGEADLLALAVRGYLEGWTAVSARHRDDVRRLLDRIARPTEYGQPGRATGAATMTAIMNGPAAASPFTGRPTGDPWAAVDALRDRVAALLVRRDGEALVGYFAVRNSADVVKFYRVRRVVEGKWMGRVFVDGQGSDDFYPVRRPEALEAVLSAILADPTGAALLYAAELGRCSRCSRTLTDEESRRAGMGPDCRAMS